MKPYYFDSDNKRTIAKAFMAYKNELYRDMMEAKDEESKEYFKVEMYNVDMLGNSLDLDRDYFEEEN